MFVTIRRYRQCAGPEGELARRARSGLLPLISVQEGFQHYCAFESADGEIYAFNVVGNAQQAVATNACILQWVGANASDLLPYPPKIAMGPCSVSAIRPGVAERDRLPFVTVRQHYRLAAEEVVMPLVRQHVLPILAASPGFWAFFAFMDRQHPGEGFGITLFNGRAEAAAANERVVATMLQLGIAPYPPAVVAGEALLLETAGAAPISDDTDRRTGTG